MNMHHSASLPDSAEAWLARLHSPECGTHEREAFERWRTQSPANAQAYAQTERLHQMAAALAGDPLLRAASLAARRSSAQRHERRRLWWLTVPIASAACLLLAFGMSFYWRGTATDTQPMQRYASATGKPQVLSLPDGTRMILDADSTVTTHFDDKRRLVVLDRGRAEFVVARTSKPFEVRAGGNTIRDIGTTFQVSKDDDAVTVGLLEGVVAVTQGDGDDAKTRTLAPDQQIRIANDGSRTDIQPLDSEAARAWAHGELMFHQRRLDALLTEMNRYSQTKLRLGDISLASLKVSGSFHAGDQDALVKALVAGWGLRAEVSAEHELTLYPISIKHSMH
ncbi:FecR family protein [Dyella tabacisoli]|uniref:DUF4880 domain-containing protein n=1 Tax=Dyella tabacisoli TaxID=2282381 RepID=A0A369UIQ9_9GAMM|nr:FecR domain-containing protein [Dyella tabacisoli]RDD80632.1 DUF4880 domain-containing protein [Dyella tabacisoli]